MIHVMLSLRLLLCLLGLSSIGSLAAQPGPAPSAEAFFTAVHLEDIDRIRELIAQGSDPNQSEPATGLTALQLSKLEGRAGLAQELTRLGAHEVPMPAPEAVLDRMFSRRIKADSPGLAVLAACGGKILYQKAFGMADLEKQRPATAESVFRIGSVTKQFTATAILLLAEDGKLKISDPLSQYFPGFPRGDDITLHHLLTHSSGLVSYTGLPSFMQTVTAEVKPEEIIARFRDLPLEFEPGSQFAYCNSGYFLLGEIVAQVSGKSYAEFLRERVFTPAGMNHTGVHRPGVIPGEAKGYSYNPETNRFAPAIDWHMTQAGGAGELFSTVIDLYHWNTALFSDRILSAQSRQLAHTPALIKAGESTTNGYGYGWSIRQLRETALISHSGGLDGFLSNLSHLPKHDFTVVLLTNSGPPNPEHDLGNLTEFIVQLYLGENLAPRKSVLAAAHLDDNALDDFTGRYDYGGAILEVTRSGKQLMAQLTGQPALEIVPQGNDKFAWKAVDAQVQFHRDPTGKITGATHYQNGISIEAKRLPSLATIELKPEVLRRYVGRYDYGNGAVMTISPGGSDHLRARLTGQPTLNIYPQSETVFVWKEVEAEIEFVTPDEGKTITGAIHRQGGQTTKVPRLKP